MHPNTLLALVFALTALAAPPSANIRRVDDELVHFKDEVKSVPQRIESQD